MERDHGIIYIGTRSGEIISLSEGEAEKKVHMRGHFDGELNGLVAHPTKNNYFTVGQDEMLACWDVKDKKSISSRDIPWPANTLSVSNNGRLLAIGSIYGDVLIIDISNLTNLENDIKNIEEVSSSV